MKLRFSSTRNEESNFFKKASPAWSHITLSYSATPKPFIEFLSTTLVVRFRSNQIIPPTKLVDIVASSAPDYVSVISF